MERFGLRDDQSERIKDFLPGREGHNAADNRLFVNAVLYRYRTGIPWRDVPAFRRLEDRTPAFHPVGEAALLIAFSSCWQAIATTNT